MDGTTVGGVPRVHALNSLWTWNSLLLLMIVMAEQPDYGVDLTAWPVWMEPNDWTKLITATPHFYIAFLRVG